MKRKKLIKLPLEEAEASLSFEQIDGLNKTVNTTISGLILICVALITLIFFRYNIIGITIGSVIVLLATLFSIVFIKSYERMQIMVLLNINKIKEDKIQTEEVVEYEITNKQRPEEDTVKPNKEKFDE